ncbi:hypothetical protein L226DRAFT_568508 [Lentinus tigrinus ALCF2SS1-7]|uniref:uncharacterized protein n=1 Tax=Lentinus tigrinus ALCF2SS1-7 TaxID=1328758 RepID=UPI001165FDB3|nr:hypothetical protein L226DRAFT_568508 [Lentinus tigrinus ALCF2SS1-7]
MSTVSSELGQVKVEDASSLRPLSPRPQRSARVKIFLSKYQKPISEDDSEEARTLAAYPRQMNGDHPYALGWLLTNGRVATLNEFSRRTVYRYTKFRKDDFVNTRIRLRMRGGFHNINNFDARRDEATTPNTPWSDQIWYPPEYSSIPEDERGVPALVIAYTRPAYTTYERMSQTSFDYLKDLLGEPRWLKGFKDKET